MAGESQLQPSSEPDPSVLTTDQLLRANRAERDYVNGQVAVLVERINGIDRATELLNETVNRTPTDIQKEVTHLRELNAVEFAGIGKQFDERDKRGERESRDNKVAVDAAFAAQKEAASEQNKSNTLAISKSEIATTETINKLSQLFDTNFRALGDKIDDLKSRVSIVEAGLSNLLARGAGQREQVTEHRQSNSALIGVAAFVITIIFVLIAIIGFFKKPGTP